MRIRGLEGSSGLRVRGIERSSAGSRVFEREGSMATCRSHSQARGIRKLAARCYYSTYMYMYVLESHVAPNYTAQL